MSEDVRSHRGPSVDVGISLSAEPLVEVEKLAKTFLRPATGEVVRAVNDISLSIARGESLGLVGESGSGKTTVGRCLLRLAEPTKGTITFDGINITRIPTKRLRKLRHRMQMIFQDPYDSVNPRMTVGQTVEEPLRVGRRAPRSSLRTRVAELLKLVSLDASFVGRYPHELSGGQLQRVGIARALAREPELLVLDEPTSALDWLIRDDILELLRTLRKTLGLTYLLISHDLGAVRSTCDRVAVMYLGRIVEEGPAERLFAKPEHPYTRALLSARLEPERDGSLGRRQRIRLRGDPPSSVNLPEGCPLHPRCPIANAACASTVQTLVVRENGHAVACMRLTNGDSIEWPEEFLGYSGVAVGSG